MKTVQEVLKSFAPEDLVDAYAERDNVKFYRLKWKGSGQMRYGKLKKKYRRYIRSFLDELLNIVPKEPENRKHGIIFAFPHVIESNGPIHELVFYDELKKEGEQVSDYSYSLTNWSEIMGYLVADNRFTQENLLPVMAQVMYEMSWYGFTWAEVRKYGDGVVAIIEECEEQTRREEGENLGEQEECLNDWEEHWEKQSNQWEDSDKIAGMEEKERLDRTFKIAWRNYQDYLRGKELREILANMEG